MIDPIAKLHSPTGTLVSVYVNRRPSATRAELVDLLRPLRSPVADRAAAKAVRSDMRKIVDLANRIERDQAPAVAIFASETDCIFEYLPLTQPVEAVASIGPRPHLRPLRARPRPLRAGVMVADTVSARTYLSAGGGFHEIGEEMTADPGKENYGGFAGYEEQRTRGRAEEVAAKLWRQAGRRLLEAHQDQPLDLIVLGSHSETFDGIADQLHPYLRSLSQGRIALDQRILTGPELAAAVAEEIERERGRQAERLLDQLLTEVHTGGDAVTGLSPVLEACNAHAVDHLVVAGPFAKPGKMCDECSWLGRSGSSCPVCGAATCHIEDIVGAAMDATVEAGGRVELVHVASRLDADGVGALLRFKVV